MKTIFERMGGTYRKVGDYYIPNLVLFEETGHQIGKYGRMRLRYLKEYQREMYQDLVRSGKLDKHLEEIDRICDERMEALVALMSRQEGVTEDLKARSQMEWVGRINSIRNRAEEIVLREVVYA